jgi:copper transport protein
LAVAAIAIVAALIPQPGLAHAQLLQSDPRPGAVVASVPEQVTLIFSEPVTPAGAGIRIYSPSGRQVEATVTARGSVLSARVDSTESGTYVVLWQVYAADTHPSRGAFDFAVGASGPNPYAGLVGEPEVGTATPLGVALQALARWVHFIGFALCFGVLAYGVVVGRKERLGLLISAGAVLLIVAEPLSLLGQLTSLSFDSETALAVLASGFGRILGLRLGAALLAWTLIATERSWPVLAVGGVVALLDGASAHAIPSLPAAGQLLVAVHVGAMGLWVGGLLAFLRSPDARFGRYALWTFGAAAVTGLVLALSHTDFGAALLTTDYGRLLVVKVLVVGGAGLLALARRHRPEALALAVAIACAALLASLPPPA